MTAPTAWRPGRTQASAVTGAGSGPQRGRLWRRLADRSPSWPVLAACVPLVAIAAVLRLWDLGSKPGWQSDETVYTDIARNLATSGSLSEHIQYHANWAPFLFHPPFYFLLLAGWFKITGAGVPQARLLSVIASLITLCLLMRLIWRLHGPVPALVTATFVAFDGWLLYVQRVSYIENTLTVIIVAGFLLYERALREPSARRFALAGAVLGFAVVFKHTGSYVLVAVLLNWLLIRKHTRKHWLLLAAAGAVVAVYLAVMIPLFDRGHNDWYLPQTLVQVKRVLGLQTSRGTLSSPAEFVYLLTHQYVVFVPSLAVALAGVTVIVSACARARSLEPLRRNSLLVSWSAAGLVVLGASAIRYQQYFALVLIPLYCLLWTEVCRYVRAHPRTAPAAAAAGLVVLAASLSTFYVRVLARDDNALAEVQQYAQSRIPSNSVVITEEEIGDEIPQPWCAVARAGICGRTAAYAITYQSYLQPAVPPGDRAFQTMMTDATPIAVFEGFKETITVWQLPPQTPPPPQQATRKATRKAPRKRVRPETDALRQR